MSPRDHGEKLIERALFAPSKTDSLSGHSSETKAKAKASKKAKPTWRAAHLAVKNEKLAEGASVYGQVPQKGQRGAWPLKRWWLRSVLAVQGTHPSRTLFEAGIRAAQCQVRGGGCRARKLRGAATEINYVFHHVRGLMCLAGLSFRGEATSSSSGVACVMQNTNSNNNDE